jgi:hypothetical protein
MEKHRASVETSPTTSRRWVWELIQNAKDVNIDGKVRVRIDSDLEDPDAHVTFSHSGGAFTTENIRFLIEQVSSKERTKDSTGRPTATGRFGTGFLTTQLLSETVTVNGVVQEDDLTPRQFELSLDRSGNESNIIVSVAAAKQSMDDLDVGGQEENGPARHLRQTCRRYPRLSRLLQIIPLTPLSPPGAGGMHFLCLPVRPSQARARIATSCCRSATASSGRDTKSTRTYANITKTSITINRC